MILAIVDHLRGAPFRQVGGAADLPESEEGLQASPAAFVLPMGDRPGENQLIGAISQTVKVTFDVVIAVSRKGAASAAALDPLETVQAAVMDKLLGWSPDADYAPFEYAGGQMLKVGKSALWWRMSFVTDYLLRKV